METFLRQTTRRPSDRSAAQTAATRTRIMLVAERLFAERGIEAVSIREINLASKQANNSAIAYHFGNREGLIQAVRERHFTRVSLARARLIDALDMKHISLREAAHILVQPIAEEVFNPDGGSAYVRIEAQLTVANTLKVFRTPSLISPPWKQLQKVLELTLAELPKEIAQQRLMMAAVLLFHGLADYSTLIESLKLKDARANTELFLKNLEDGMVGLLGAPVAKHTAASARALPSWRPADISPAKAKNPT